MELRDPFPRPPREIRQNGMALRLAIYSLLVVLAFGILAGRLWQLQILQGEFYRQRANTNRFRIESIPAPRGVIYDRDGEILVRNRATFTVQIVPADLPEDREEQVYQTLARLLDMPVSNRVAGIDVPARPGIREIVAAGRKSDPYSPVTIQSNVSREVALAIEESLLALPGVHVEVNPIRQYLAGPLMAHILGYMGPIPREWADTYREQGYAPDDRVGLAGIEYTLEETLRGRKGQRVVEVNVLGRTLRTVGPALEPQAGTSLYLTLDLDLQQKVATILQEALQQIGSSSGVAIVGKPKTGEILALVSLPTYDNNLFAAGISAEDWERLTSAPSNPLLNRAISGLYPPGSIFKLIPAAAALQEGVITPDTLIDDPGVIWVKNRYSPDDPTLAQPFYCWLRSGHGKLNVVGALAQSCDVFFYEVAGGFEEFRGLGVKRLAHYAALFGLGEPTGIDLPGELAGLIPTPEWKRKRFGGRGGVWTTGNTYNMGIGQGDVLVTPLQMFNMVAVVANGGFLYRPQIVRRLVDAQGYTLEEKQPELIRRLPIEPAYLALVREGMRRAVIDGTARPDLSRLPEEVRVAGKTGTAEFCHPNEAGTDCVRDEEGNLLTHAWFVAFAPYEDPEIAVVVFIDGEGVGRVIEGSQVAAPVAANIIRHYFGLSLWQSTPTPAPTS